MTEKIQQIANLLIKYNHGELTLEEMAILEKWLSESEANRQLFKETTDIAAMDALLIDYAAAPKMAIWNKVQQQINIEIPLPVEERPVASINYWKIFYIAAAIIVVAGGVWLYIANTPSTNNVVTTTSEQSDPLNSQPGSKAALTLADGRKFLLQEMPDGPIGSDGGFQISKSKGTLIYEGHSDGINETIYNTITTPNGGQFKVMLPDSTILNLNVGSEIKYKVSLTELTREVQVIKGEIFFEVEKNIDKKLWVALPATDKNGGIAKIEVTGTRFNINVDDDDSKEITLLQGSLNVYSPSSHQATAHTLQEGDQAQLYENGKITILQNVDTSAIAGWRNGIVHFNQTPARKVLNKLEKWYDVKVDYGPSQLPSCPITGTIIPELTIQDALQTLEKLCSGLHLTYDSTNKKIIVLP